MAKSGNAVNLFLGAVAALTCAVAVMAGDSGKDPMGACCLPDGSCTVALPVSCLSTGGDYQGDLSLCGDLKCPSPPETCMGDLNGDRSVDVEDLVKLFTAWGPCGSNCIADLHVDGKHDVRDLTLLITNWGDCPAAP